MKHSNIAIFIPHLGCPFTCIYCDQKKISAQREVPQATQVTEIIESCLQTMAEDTEVEVAFFGGNFTAIDQRLQEEYLGAVQPYLRDGRVKNIRISTRPDFINRPILDFLSVYGIKTIELGVQSLSDAVLRASSRGYQTLDVFRSSRLIKERGFNLGIQLMVGLPCDNFQLDLESAEQTVLLGPQEVRIYPTLVLAGTYLEKMYRQGDYQALEMQEALNICKEMLLVFQKHSIRVIRMGLYPGGELLNKGVIVAGPFHPRFGELVEQAIFKEQISMALGWFFKQFGYLKKINLYVNFRDVSKVIGSRRSNLAEITELFSLQQISVKSDKSLDRDWVGIGPADQGKIYVHLSRRQFIKARCQC